MPKQARGTMFTDDKTKDMQQMTLIQTLDSDSNHHAFNQSTQYHMVVSQKLVERNHKRQGFELSAEPSAPWQLVITQFHPLSEKDAHLKHPL